MMLRWTTVAAIWLLSACGNRTSSTDRLELGVSVVIDAAIAGDAGPDGVVPGPTVDAGGYQTDLSVVVNDSPPDAAPIPDSSLSGLDEYILRKTKWATSISLFHTASLSGRTLPDGTIVTDAEFEDIEDLLGPTPPLKITLQGGTANGVSSYNPEFPMAQPNGYYIAVFWKADDGHPLLAALLDCKPDGTITWAAEGVALTKQEFIDKVRNLSPLWKVAP